MTLPSLLERVRAAQGGDQSVCNFTNFTVGDAVRYEGQRCNTTFGHIEASPLRFGRVYIVESACLAWDITGSPIPTLLLVGVGPVMLETGRQSRKYAAANFAPALITEFNSCKNCTGSVATETPGDPT